MGEARMHCREILAELWAFIDQEMDAATQDQLQQHLDRCQHCFPQYDFQRAFRAFIAKKCTHAAPPELRRKVFMQLLSEEGEPKQA
jgi:mycothiol system anti-sigma-R factor